MQWLVRSSTSNGKTDSKSLIVIGIVIGKISSMQWYCRLLFTENIALARNTA